MTTQHNTVDNFI